jgi:hypothetical protein
MAECIAERVRGVVPDAAIVVWHLAGPRKDSWWRPIRCSRTEGIVAPGHSEERQPTCTACLALLPPETPEDQ